MNITNLEEQRARLARHINLLKTGRLKEHMVGENGTSAKTIRDYEAVLVNMDHQIAFEKRRLT